METLIVFLLPFFFSTVFPQGSTTVPKIGFVKSGTIRVDDHTLSDWDGIKPIQNLTCANHWQNPICGKAPDSCRQDRVDLQASFYLAWDGANLFFAVDVIDDTVLAVPSTDKNLYRGDSAELFFVEECASQSDYHDCVSTDKPVFQLILCPSELNNKKYHFAEYRTPTSIIQSAFQNGFQASGWRSNNGWQAEVIFPLKALGKTRTNIKGGQRVKISFDVLDYDRKLAKWQEPCWGFAPDNVVSNVEKQEMATNPTRMIEFIFESSK